MTTRKTAIAAAVKVVTRGNAAFVLASNTENLPKNETEITACLAQHKYAKFGCVACGTSMVSQASVHPRCITCGGAQESVKKLEDDVKATVTAKTNLATIHCSACQASTILEEAVATAIISSAGDKSSPTPIHCSTCGEPLVVSAEAGEVTPGNSVPDTLDPAANNDPQSLATPDTPPEPKVTADAVTADADEMGDVGELELDDDIDLDNLGSMEDDGDDLALETDEFDQPVEAGDVGTMAVPGTPAPVGDFAQPEPDDAGGFTMATTDFPVSDGAPQMTADVNDVENDVPEDPDFAIADGTDGDALVDALDVDDTEQALAFVKANNRLVAMKGHLSIASLSKNSKTQNASLVDSPALVAATQAAIATDGLRKGLTAMGFTLIKVPVTSEATVSRKVQAAAQKAEAVTANEKKLFAESIALAAAGLARGMWRGVENPLRAAMESELERAGVERPSRVVSEVFASAGIPYTEALVTVANRLTKMTAAARKDFAEMLNMTSAVSPDAELDDAIGGDTDATAPVTINSRITSGGRSTATAALLRPSPSSSGKAVTAASQVLSGNQAIPFNF